MAKLAVPFKYSVMIKKCIDNSTCPFVQTFEKDIMKLGFTPGNMVFYSLVTVKVVWEMNGRQENFPENIKVLFGKPTPGPARITLRTNDIRSSFE